MTFVPPWRRESRWFPTVATGLVAFLLGFLAAIPSSSGASLTLSDGRVLQGKDVRRDGDVYLLEVDDGSVIPVPVALVSSVGIGGAPPPKPPPPPIPPPVPGLTYGQPQQIAGTPVAPQAPHEQLAAFGEPARLQGDVVHSDLQPNYWVMDPSEHNWRPSTWAKAPIDSTWHPESAFDPSEDVLADSRSEFQKAPIDSTWVPKDGFAKKPW